MEFTRLSDVALVNEVSEDVNVLIEDNGEIKKASKSEIGAQADWNEENEASPAFILNKPTSLGGYAYYATYGNYIVKCDGPEYPADGVTESTATVEEFVNDYKTKPIMLIRDSDDLTDWDYGLHPVVNCWYNSYYTNRLGVVCFSGYSPTQCDFYFAE